MWIIFVEITIFTYFLINNDEFSFTEKLLQAF